MNTSETHYYAHMTPQELSDTLGLTLEEAEATLRSWNRSLPVSDQEQQSLRTAAIRYEYGMRGLNYDLSCGRISPEEYIAQESLLNSVLFGK